MIELVQVSSTNQLDDMVPICYTSSKQSLSTKLFAIAVNNHEEGCVPRRVSWLGPF